MYAAIRTWGCAHGNFTMRLAIISSNCLLEVERLHGPEWSLNIDHTSKGRLSTACTLVLIGVALCVRERWTMGCEHFHCGKCTIFVSRSSARKLNKLQTFFTVWSIEHHFHCYIWKVRVVWVVAIWRDIRCNKIRTLHWFHFCHWFGHLMKSMQNSDSLQRISRQKAISHTTL